MTPQTPWLRIIKEIEKFWPNYRLEINGVPSADIDAAEERVGFPFPQRYREFLGLFGESGTPTARRADVATDFRLESVLRYDLDVDEFSCGDEGLVVGFFESFHGGMDGAICMSLRNADEEQIFRAETYEYDRSICDLSLQALVYTNALHLARMKDAQLLFPTSNIQQLDKYLRLVDYRPYGLSDRWHRFYRRGNSTIMIRRVYGLQLFIASSNNERSGLMDSLQKLGIQL